MNWHKEMVESLYTTEFLTNVRKLMVMNKLLIYPMNTTQLIDI